MIKAKIKNSHSWLSLLLSVVLNRSRFDRLLPRRVSKRNVLKRMSSRSFQNSSDKRRKYDIQNHTSVYSIGSFWFGEMDGRRDRGGCCRNYFPLLYLYLIIGVCPVQVCEHLSSFSSKMNVTCNYCSKNFATEQDFNVHTEMFHQIAHSTNKLVSSRKFIRRR